MATTPSENTVTPAIASPKTRLFRRTDWLAFFFTFAAVWTVYFITLGPEVTLEDSGELVTGSMYAGIPHPPGYPVWTLYSWLWTVLLPVGNMAWRVAMGQAFSGAAACGLLALMVSRGSSMFVESIESLRSIAGKWENSICIVSGFTAGLLVGLDRFVWSESVVVNRIAVFSMPWVMLVLVCLLRWLYTPGQLRYACIASLLFGICITIHQSLVVAALAIEVFVALGNPRMGRNAFLGNFILYAIYMAVYLFTPNHVHLLANFSREGGGMFVIFNIIGIASLLAGVGLTIWTRGLTGGWLPVITMFVLFWVGVSFYLYMPLACMSNPPMEWCYPRTVDGFWHAITRGQYDQPNPTNIITQSGRFIEQLFFLAKGLAQEFTWPLLLLALVPFLFVFRMRRRELAWLLGLTTMYLCLGVLLTILLNPNPDRSSEDLMRVFFTSSHTIIALLIGHGLALTAASMAAQYRRFRVWGLAGGGIAVVLALCTLFIVTGRHYFGPAGRLQNLAELPHWVLRAFAKDQYGLPIFGALILLGLIIIFVVALAFRKNKAPLGLTLAVFLCLPLYSALSNWHASEQHNHWFGYWFGHDMFTPPPFKGSDSQPLYPAMAKDAILFGGTDPGRFCPTYMIFCDSFTPHSCQPAQDQQFDRRDVYLITQNALADIPYLRYIRAQYYRSAQVDPPFFQNLLRPSAELRDDATTNALARAATPLMRPLDNFFAGIGEKIEKRRRTSTSWFRPEDFVDLPAFTAKLRPPQQDPLSRKLYESLSVDTRRVLGVPADEQRLRQGLASDLNRLLEAGPLYQPGLFETARFSAHLQEFVKQNPQGHTRVRLNRMLLEETFPGQIARSPGGLYPDLEIYTPTVEDLEQKVQEYEVDLAARYQAGRLDPGESVTVVDGRLQFNGQASIMAINGLLAKVIFDHNPKNEFYVEESLPLKWMYPHLSPFGIIMKVNRQPLPELTEEIVARDHQFWSQYSDRLIGNWITYDTPLTNILAWAEKLYLRRDFNGFTGDHKFAHDDQAQKAFSKLRSAIGNLYLWRMTDASNRDPRTRQRMMKEADFALRQALAFCPYNIETISHLVTLLANTGRFEDALQVLRTCSKFDPLNPWFSETASLVTRWRDESSTSKEKVQQMLAHVQSHPDDFQAAFDLASTFAVNQQPGVALEILDRVLRNPHADATVLRPLLQAYSSLKQPERLKATVEKLKNSVQTAPTNTAAALALAEGFRLLGDTNSALQLLEGLRESPGADLALMSEVAQQYLDLGDFQKLEAALETITRLRPEAPESWYNLAALKAALGKTSDALSLLEKSLQLSAQRLQRDAKARDLSIDIQRDPRFDPLRRLPEFDRITKRTR